MSKSLKIVVVGPGLIGKKHIQLIHDNPNCELAAIVAPDNNLNHEIATTNGVKLFTSLELCIASQLIDGVIISSPNEFHCQQGQICIQAGIPVVIEKPITSNIDDGIKLCSIVRDKNAKVLIGHHRAYSPLMINAKKIIDSGKLGRLVTVMGSAQFYKPSHYFEDGPWRKEIGGGPILINLIHEIGNLRSLCGEISAVNAISSNVVRKFAVEDTVAINFIFKNGMLGTFLLSDTAASTASWEATTQENPSFPTCREDNCYLINGTNGSLSVPTMTLKYYDNGVTPSWWSPLKEEVIVIERHDPLKCQLEHFLDVIKNNTAPIVSVYDGFRNLQIIEAIRESATKNVLVNLHELTSFN
jgi:predicted dehydrogenase